jgi:crossover junction endodeoxyribonuclease RusA
VVEFFVPGVAAPKGSMRVVTHGKGGRPLPRPLILQDNPRTKAWTRTVANIARLYVPAQLAGAVAVTLVFAFERPKSHVLKSGRLRKGAPGFPGHSHGDVDKLARTVLDGLTGIAFADDTQVVELAAWKSYLEPGESRPGCRITLESLDARTVAGTQLPLVRTES